MSLNSKMAEERTDDDLAEKPKFSLGRDEEVYLENGDVLKEESETDKPKTGKSRFRVEFVEAAPQEAGEGQSAPKPDDDSSSCSPQTPPRPRAARVRTVSETSAPNSPGSITNDTYYTHYDTHNLKTFGQNTLESLPKLDHYRNLESTHEALRKRPTLTQLHENPALQEEPGASEQPEQNGHVPPTTVVEIEETIRRPAPKFGWIKGVLVRCLLNIWGVMLFLRLSWVVGQAGIGFAVLIVLLAGVVTTLTSLSMAAICTNGEVKGGGAYYMISRSLGPEFGGAIGLIFSVANAVAVAMYVVGFSETIRDILKDHDCLMVDEINDVRIIGVITVILLFGVTMVGMEWEARAQIGLLFILLIAMVNFVIGSLIPPNADKSSKGFLGYSGKIFTDNLGPDFRGGEGFFSVFSIFFPAATGILAGANISGDLKDAQKAIPKGTLLAILISTITYIVMACLAGSCVVRDAAGPISELVAATANSSVLQDLTTLLYSTAAPTVLPEAATEAANGTDAVTCVIGSCKYGLQNDMQVMQLVSGFGPLTIAGIISATLSSALASLVSAPKVFQAVCKDRLFPGIHWFAKGYGKGGEEPWRGYVLAMLIGLGFILIGELNAIAPLISNFFLMSYALINYSCFDASLARSPGWRPAFRYYSMWMSLVGALLCLAVMFIINWWTALITFAVVAALYVYVRYSKPDVNWGSSTQAHVYRSALISSLKLVSVLEHVKNYRPQMLVLTGCPERRPALVDLASSITKNQSLMVCGNVVLDDADNLSDFHSRKSQVYRWLRERKVKAFYTAVSAISLRNGIRALMQTVGVGKLCPNMVLIGFKRNWQNAELAEIQEYFNIIHDAFDLNNGVGILRVPEGLDFTDFRSKENASDVNLQASAASLAESEPEVERKSLGPLTRVIGISKSTQGKLQGMNRFIRKQKTGTIDVWWLFDDGGLTLLIPYILSTKSMWQRCKLRVFFAGSKKGELDRDQRKMALMLSKFRIECSSMTVIPDVGKRPENETYNEFKKLIQPWLSEEGMPEQEGRITQEELIAQKERTYRHLRLRELLKQHSSDATLIVMTLPMPKKSQCSAGLYMSWIESLTQDMPPILLLRGNQDSVLTYYS